jgi:response regulator of citrate/malate metabolism
MEYKPGSKKENMNKVISAIEQFETNFIINDIISITKLNHYQCKKYLTGCCELGLIKYSNTIKIYIKC